MNDAPAPDLAMPALPWLLPRPDPVWGPAPTRPDAAPPPWRGWRALFGALAGVVPARSARVLPGTTAAAAAAGDAAALDPARLAALRHRLRREGLAGAPLAAALGAAAAAAVRTLGQTPRANQLEAAAAMLDQQLVELATGEGKTLAIALAACAAALAGVPVHVVTANDYLAQRDAAALAPMAAALGLVVGARPGADDEAARRAVYGADIVYASAKDLAFDHLREQHGALAPVSAAAAAAAALAGVVAPAPVMRGLALALIDEADSILLDEAEMPLILSQPAPQAARRAFLWQALALARRLDPGADFVHHAAEREVRLTPAGEAQLAAAAAKLGGPWARPRYRREAVQLALTALHALRRHVHYVVRGGAVEVLDEVTGRVAAGRVWSRGLHTLLALKEGVAPPDETETLARTTFQRFFRRYWRLGGLSGTLHEARAELRAVYGLPVRRLARARPSRLRRLPPRLHAMREAMLDAAARRAQALAGAGRPVLLAVDSVADADRVAERLTEAGVAHRVLHALHDADEAAIVAGAGRAGQVTVATRMAGRGTDIACDAAALAAGGLHVLSCQRNASRRLDRQLEGRAARRGEPGSVERWFLGVPDVTPPPACDGLLQDGRGPAEKPSRWTALLSPSARAWLALQTSLWLQRREERRRAALRRDLVRQEALWEARLGYTRAG